MTSLGAHQVIAIDGPAASGKSSVARALAQRLGFVYVNSGAMYRAVTWLVLQRGIDPKNLPAVKELAEKAPLSAEMQANEFSFRIDGIDPEPFLRSEQVNDNVSQISRIGRVREILVAELRRYAQANDLVMEGRDIGSVVFPATPFKFYIDASPEIRQQRRAAQGQHDRVRARDQADSSRHTSPLVIAEDAQVIDSSELTIEGVLEEIITRLKSKGLTITR